MIHIKHTKSAVDHQTSSRKATPRVLRNPIRFIVRIRYVLILSVKFLKWRHLKRWYYDSGLHFS